jgi:amino acid adenylation domain-containing protein
MIHTVEDSCPLSPVQQGMLFHHLSGAHSGVDVEQIVVDYPESLDAAFLRAAWEAEIQRQPVLRTGFRWKDATEPLQDIHSGVEFEYTISDWSSQPEQERDRAFEEYLLKDRQRGFDLAVPPLMRVALFRFGEGHYRMLWTFHHILVDGRSFVTILQEVDRLYEQGEGGESVTFGEYKSFIEWLHNYDHSPSEEFWRSYLKGFTAPTPLPFDPDARAVKDGQRYGQQELRLSAALSNRLRALVEKTGTTLNTVCMGAWAILLSRYSGESDIVFGATKTGRRGLTAVGLFLNTLPVRIDAGRERSVSEFLKDLRGRWLSLRPFEYTPLVKIKESSELPASGSLFDSLVVFENQRFDNVLATGGGKWPGRQCRLLEQTNYTLSFLAYGDPEILVKLEYDARRYTDPAVARMLGHLERILDAMAANPEAMLGSLEMLCDQERRRILYDWNRTEAEYPRDILTPDAIAAAAAAAPDRVSAVFGESSVTYADLNRRAGQLARYLQRRGIGPGSLVGVHVERSMEMLVALLGVMKSGAGYVPLDPGFPPERLRFMAEDAALGALITQTNAQAAPAPNALRVEIDGDWPAISAESTAELPCPATPDDVAYVLYTSGSTGKPKGVQITHRALANFLYAMAREPGLATEDVLLAVTTISFDIAGLELYLPLMLGARVVLAAKDASLDMQALAGLIQAHNISVMQATPATWQMLLDSGWEGKRGLKVLCGGEALSRDLAMRLAHTCGELWNMYGPTETTIWSLVRRIGPEDRTILIGRAIANTSIYILDENRNPVPPGVAGELYIGGDGVSIGYLNRPELTGERFIADPFRPGAGTVFKTGDLARFWPDGEVECLGRNDFQVKIRGFRIELGEIESALKEHPAVRQSVVTAREDQLGKRLVGYVITQGADRPSTADLKAFLARRLPDYMVPGQFVFLEAFPLTPNGKVNRLALPPPVPAAAVADDSYVAPRDEFERQLCQAWSEVLGVGRVGVHDNFFDLGGHSLLAVQLALRVQKILPGQQLPLSALLEAPTVERFAAWLRSRKTDEWQYLVRVRPGDSARRPFFCVHGAGGNVLSMRPLMMAMPDNLPCYCLQARGLDGSTPFQSVEETARCYVDEIRKVQPHGPYCLGGGCYGGVVAFEMARMLTEAGEAVAALFLMDSYNFAFGNFLPRRELLLRNAWFYFRRGAFHGRRLLALSPRQWPGFAAGRLRGLRRHAAGLARMMTGLRGTQFPFDRATFEVKGAGGTQLGEVLERVKRASFIATGNFVPRPYDGRAVVFRAGTRMVEPYRDQYLGWGPVVRGGIEAFEIQGDHDSIFELPEVKAMAGIINAKISEACGRTAANAHSA